MQRYKYEVRGLDRDGRLWWHNGTVEAGQFMQGIELAMHDSFMAGFGRVLVDRLLFEVE